MAQFSGGEARPCGLVMAFSALKPSTRILGLGFSLRILHWIKIDALSQCHLDDPCREACHCPLLRRWFALARHGYGRCHAERVGLW